MAAPHVAGTVALMYQAASRPLSINEVRRVLIGTTDPHPGPPGRSSTQLGYGYLNTEAAVAAVRELTSKPAAGPVGDRPIVRHELFEEDGLYSEEDPAVDELPATLASGDEDFGDEDLNDQDFGDEDFGDEDFDDEQSLGPEEEEEDAGPDEPLDTPASSFAYEVDALGLDSEAAFRPRPRRRSAQGDRE